MWDVKFLGLFSKKAGYPDFKTTDPQVNRAKENTFPVQGPRQFSSFSAWLSIEQKVWKFCMNISSKVKAMNNKTSDRKIFAKTRSDGHQMYGHTLRKQFLWLMCDATATF